MIRSVKLVRSVQCDAARRPRGDEIEAHTGKGSPYAYVLAVLTDMLTTPEPPTFAQTLSPSCITLSASMDNRLRTSHTMS